MLKYEVLRGGGKYLSYIGYFRYNKTHRIDGPAVLWVDGTMQYAKWGNTIRKPQHAKM